jgi:RimJ/RimL family protein N-acetyltransferase
MYRPMDDSDAQFLYNCLRVRLTEPDTNISHLSLPTYDEHLKFIAALPYLEYNIIVDQDERVGYIYLTKTYEIGVFVMPEYRGHGYGKKAIRDIIIRHPKTLYANIGPRNRNSKILFEALGFEKIQETYSLDTEKQQRYKELHKIPCGE